MLRAIEETTITGVATTLPADVIILSDDEFVAGTHSTKWVETNLDFSSIASPLPVAPTDTEELVRHDVVAEVNGKRVSVALYAAPGAGGTAPRAATAAKTRRPKAAVAAGNGDVTAPMQGTIVKVAVAVGDEVSAGDTVVILEAMKMENAVVAQRAGVVESISVTAGDSVSAGDVVAVIS